MADGSFISDTSLHGVSDSTFPRIPTFLRPKGSGRSGKGGPDSHCPVFRRNRQKKSLLLSEKLEGAVWETWRKQTLNHHHERDHPVPGKKFKLGDKPPSLWKALKSRLELCWKHKPLSPSL